MAEEDQNQDTAQKTEEPTEHRLKEAIEKGQIPISRDLNSWMVVVSLWLLVSIVIPLSGKKLLTQLSFFLAQLPTGSMGIPEVYNLVHVAGIPFAITLSLWLLIPFVGVFIVGLGQTNFQISLTHLKPRMERLSIIKGFHKIFGLTTVIEFLKTLIKFLCMGALCGWLLYDQTTQYIALPHMPIVRMVSTTHRHLETLVMAAVIFMGVMAAGDFFYQRFQWRKNLRMSKQDLRDEYKKTEGDPVIKGRIKSIRQEKARKRMIAAVPAATVVVMNPTHYAVALRYDPESMDAPRVVAKGMDFLALTIRDVAQSHHIPIVQDAPLARLLYQDVPLDETIPEKHYQAVAKLIRWVLSLDQR